MTEPRADAPGGPKTAPRSLPGTLFPGSRDIWIAGGVLLAIAACFLAWFVLKPRGYFTGSTSVTTRSVVATLSAGSRLCLPDLPLSADTRRIQLDLGGSGEGQPASEATVRIQGRRQRTTIPGRQASEFLRQAIGVPAPAPGSQYAGTRPALLCIKALGDGLTVGGMAGVTSPQPSPIADGKPLNAQVSAWFLPAAGERKSLAGLFPEIARRAALFRPDPVGAWTYWVLLLVGMPALAWLSLAALADPRSRRAVAFIVLAGAISGGSWALITSPFDAPDESEHFAAYQYVAETGKQVDRSVGQRSTYSSEQVDLLQALNHFQTIESPSGRKPWLQSQVEAFDRLKARGPPRDDGGGGAITTSAGNTAYYVLIAPSYLVASPGGILATVLAGRLTSTLFLVLIALCAFGTVRELFPSRRRLAVAAGLLVLLAPVLSFLGGAINTDMGVNAADALLIYLVIRAMRRGATPLLMGSIALVAVLAVLTKATAWALIPAAILGVVVALVRAGRGALVGVAALAAGLGAGLAAKYAIAAFLGPPRAGGGAPTLGPPTSAALKPAAVFSYAWQTFFPRLPNMTDKWSQSWPFFDIYVKRGFGAFGWYAYVMPKAVLDAIVAGMAGILGCGLFTALRRREAVWRYKWEIAVLILVVVGVLGGVAAVYYSDIPRDIPAEQGRYAFPTAVAVATLAVGALIGFKAPVRRWLVVGLVVGMGTLGVLGRLVYLVGAYT